MLALLFLGAPAATDWPLGNRQGPQRIRRLEKAKGGDTQAANTSRCVVFSDKRDRVMIFPSADRRERADSLILRHFDEILRLGVSLNTCGFDRKYNALAEQRKSTDDG
jgi:hypothetical protein